MFGQHSVDSHGQARSDPSHTEIGEIIQTPVSQCPPCGKSHMTLVPCRTLDLGCQVTALVASEHFKEYLKATATDTGGGVTIYICNSTSITPNLRAVFYRIMLTQRF